MNKKQKQLARKSAFSYKAKDNAIMVVEDFNFDIPKTKKFIDILSALKIEGKKVLLLTGGKQENVYKSGRNLPKIDILEANKPSTYEILHADVLLIQESAVSEIEKTFNSTAEVGA
jgi:large subunit ribosomal protein L4